MYNISSMPPACPGSFWPKFGPKISEKKWPNFFKFQSWKNEPNFDFGHKILIFSQYFDVCLKFIFGFLVEQKNYIVGHNFFYPKF